MTETDQQFWRRILMQAFLSILAAVILAEMVTVLSTGHLGAQQRERAMLTAFYAPFLIAPPIIAYTTRQSWRIHRLMKQLDAAAHLDELTGLANRRAFMRDAGALLDEYDPASGPLGIALIDIDHFKRINDRHGHEAGDAALAHIAQTMKSSLPEGVLLARLGGEEFALLAPAENLAGLRDICETLRQRVATRLLRQGDAVISATVSLGLSLIRPGDTVSSGLSRADDALYEAKAAGRNCLQLEAA